MKHLLSTLLFAIIVSVSFSQNEFDALRYSYSRFGGTALSSSMAGSTGAIGGDFSGIALNPAGLAMYRRNEFSFSPSFDFTNSVANYYGNSRNDSKLNFNVSNIGIVIYNPSVNRMKTKGWLSSTFAFGLTRLGGIGGRFTASGINNQSSLADAMVQSANGKSPNQFDPFYEALGYEAYLFDPKTGSQNQYVNNNGPVPGFGGQQQRLVVDRKGAISEWTLAYSGNYSNKLFIGAAAGIQKVVFEQEYTLQETDVADTIANFKSLRYANTFEDRGRGFVFRAGAIYKFSDAFRLGVSGQIPVLVNFSSTYSSTLVTEFATISTSPQNSPQGEYSFKLNTPARVALQGAYQIGKSAMISADIERVNYASAGYRTNDGALENANDRINTILADAINLKVGIEKRFDEFYLRGGYANYGNPYQNSQQLNGGINLFTLGGGYRDDEYFYDVGIVFANVKEEFFAYDNRNVNIKPADVSMFRTNLIFSMGYRF